jgi:hypothetical protein
MKISYERTGGFAGMRVALDLDSQDLPASEAATLESLVKDADFFHLTEAISPKVMMDGFQYSITVEGNGQKRTIRAGDSAVPEALKPLLDNLSARAHSQRRSG